MDQVGPTPQGDGSSIAGGWESAGSKVVNSMLGAGVPADGLQVCECLLAAVHACCP
jgi:hypothetical protein